MDSSCIQPLVRRPSSKSQIAWSLIGILFIVWDMITIPLELFDQQEIIVFHMLPQGFMQSSYVSLLESACMACSCMDVWQEMIDFLVVVGRFSFGYWLLDMPLHLIFGVEIDGHLELRPKILVKMYLRSWFCIDAMVVGIDAVLMLLESLQALNSPTELYLGCIGTTMGIYWGNVELMENRMETTEP